MREWRRLLIAALGAALLGGALAAAAAPKAGHGGKQAQTEAQLQALRARIASVRDKVSHDEIESDRLTQELSTAEIAVAAARDRLQSLRSEQAARMEQRAALATQRRDRQADLLAERGRLAAQMRAAYLIGREEPLKLLLNQQDPARAGRMFAYYSYFGRARAGLLQGVKDNLQQLQQLDSRLAAETQQLQELAQASSQEVERLSQARAQRSAALLNIKAESRTGAQTLQKLLGQQTALTDLLRDLNRALQQFPADGSGAFAQLRGKLAWPVGGSIAARFGETRAGGLKWDGVLIDTQRGADVRAVYRGRVIYADWLPGLGLLTIIDHGNGYLSLYGHNERLFKSVGETVAGGDVIAASGDSGGSSRPELYFQIRKDSRPVDPGPWFKLARPVASR